jgi:hypothetical protein
MSIDDETGTDASSNRDVYQPLLILARAPACLAQSGGVAIVFQCNVHLEGIG